MKKLMIFALPVLMLSGCDSILMKNTTVQINASQAITTVTLPDGDYKYFGGLTKEELKDAYVDQLTKRLNNGRIHVVESGADFVLNVNRIDVTESVVNEFYDNENWKLSRVNIRAEATFNKNMVDIPTVLVFESESKEDLNTNSKKGHKGSKGNYVDITGFGGSEGAMRENAREARKKVKAEIKKQN